MHNIKLRKASFLDLPFIFYQIYDDSLDGVFADRFNSRKGLVILFSFLFAYLIPFKRYLFNTSKIQEAHVYGDNQYDFGFIITQILQQKNNASKEVTIVATAIRPSHRGKGLGKMMIKSFMESLDNNTVVHAYCTKYARTMQHILRKLKFIRDKNHVAGLEHFYMVIHH